MMFWEIIGSVFIGGLVLLSAYYYWRGLLVFIFFTGGTGILFYGYLSSFGPRPWQATEHSIVGSILFGIVITIGCLYAEQKKRDKQTLMDSIVDVKRDVINESVGEREERERRLECMDSRLLDLELSLAENK